MTRKDSDKDSERPHYYSQFWLDIAAGRRTIGGPKPEDEGELLEDSQEPIVLRRPFRSEPEEDLDEVDEPIGRGERPAVLSRPVADEVSPSLDDLDAEADEVPLAADDTESLAVNDSVEDADIPDFATDEDDVEEEEEADEGEDFYDEEEEEEDDDGWVAGRGRKKVTPKRPTKQPQKRPTRRDPRRGF